MVVCKSFNRFVKHSKMGILKVVCIWCDSVNDCGLIIWGF